MPEFLALPQTERKEILEVAADASGRPTHLLEKDAWVVWTLKQMFEGPHREHLVFKGGTSLSKGFGLIDRFSEDIDLTYDIRVLAPDLVERTEDALPPSVSQGRKWTENIHARLVNLIQSDLAPFLEAALLRDGITAAVRTAPESDKDWGKVFIDYEPVATGSGYVAPTVNLDFGARSTGEPNQTKEIVCDASAYVGGVQFPTTTVTVMLPERTFWEKATAAHVFFFQHKFRGAKGFARHWYDLSRLDNGFIAEKAAADKDLALAVANHKAIFFREKNNDDKVIDYVEAISGNLKLVPEDEGLFALKADYEKMSEDGLLPESAPSFDELMTQCRSIEARVNAACLK